MPTMFTWLLDAHWRMEWKVKQNSNMPRIFEYASGSFSLRARAAAANLMQQLIVALDYLSPQTPYFSYLSLISRACKLDLSKHYIAVYNAVQSNVFN